MNTISQVDEGGGMLFGTPSIRQNNAAECNFLERSAHLVLIQLTQKCFVVSTPMAQSFENLA